MKESVAGEDRQPIGSGHEYGDKASIHSSWRLISFQIQSQKMRMWQIEGILTRMKSGLNEFCD